MTQNQRVKELIVWFCLLIIFSLYFCFLQIWLCVLCPHLIAMHAKKIYHTLSQDLEQLNFHRVQKIFLMTNLLKNTRSVVSCCDHQDKIKAISQINHRYQASTTHNASMFQIFVVKLKLLKISSGFIVVSVTNIILVLRFMQRSKIYCDRTAKIVTSKSVSY